MIIRLTEKIWIVQGGKNGRYPSAHSLYIRDDGGFLIDAGSDRGEIERLRKEEGISTVVVTHYHTDHWTFLHDLPVTEVWATAEEKPGLESMETQLSWVGALGTEWESMTRKMFIEEHHFRPTRVTRIVSDGEELRFGKTRAVAVVAPGHTAGHLCLHFPDDEILLLGDYDLSVFGPFYADLLADIGMLRRSARHLARMGVETNVVSHGGSVYRGSITGQVEAYLSVIDRREEALREFLREPRTRPQIIAGQLIYGPAPRYPWMDRIEWMHISKHLEGMIARGEVSLHEGAYVLTR